MRIRVSMVALPVLVLGLAACRTGGTHSGERRAEAGTGGDAQVTAQAGTQAGQAGTQAGTRGDTGASASAGGQMGTQDHTARAGSSGQQGQWGTQSGQTHGQAQGDWRTGQSQEGDIRGHGSDQVISGRVMSASDDKLEIESMDGQRQELSVVNETLVTIDGRDGDATDLQEGQEVRASYSRIDGRNIAVRVEAGQSDATGTGMGTGRTGSDTGSGAVRQGVPQLPDVETGADADQPRDGTSGPRPGGGRRTGDRG